jgi:hypothetical protein
MKWTSEILCHFRRGGAEELLQRSNKVSEVLLPHVFLLSDGDLYTPIITQNTLRAHPILEGGRGYGDVSTSTVY